MHLGEFIERHMNEILTEWESFASSLASTSGAMSPLRLRDHAEAILHSIALDIDTAQSATEQFEKSRGQSRIDADTISAASVHGGQRHACNFTLLELSAEFRALRAAVLRLWLQHAGTFSSDSIHQMIRFNEGIDQALAESIVTYSADSVQARELFLAILGHDLRAPLATMTVSGALLSQHGLSCGAVRDAGARIRRSALQMSSMVNDLIGYTRTQLGSGMPIKLEATDMIAVCRSAIEDAQSSFPGIRFELAFDSSIGGAYDSVRLHQLFTNLLINAAKYGEHREPVTMRAILDRDAVCVEVNNRGPMIPQGEWRRLFEPLVRLPGTGSAAFGEDRTSLGLGLYVAREIARLHGGSIEVASSAEAGTTFSVRLPCAAEDQPHR